MHKIFRKLMIAGLLFTSLSIGGSYVTSATTQTVYERKNTEQIAKGLTYELTSKLTSSGWVDIHVLKMDLSEPTLGIDLVRDQTLFGKTTKLSTMTNQDTRYIGAINASFFNMGMSQSGIEGFEYTKGDINFAKHNYNTTDLRAASMIINEGSNPLLAFVSTQMKFVTAEKTSIYVVGINVTGDLKNAVIFNDNAFATSKALDALASLYKVVVENDVITAIKEPGIYATMPANGYIMTLHKDQAATVSKLYVGQKVTLSTTTNIDTSKLKLAIPGGGLILKDGKSTSQGLIIGETARHPRTAIGITADNKTMIAMVVDGRGQSIGATHAEMAKYMLEFNVSNAMHYDGGGSSTMVTRPLGDFLTKAINTPSDGRERSIVNGLGFVTSAEKTADFNLTLTASQLRSFINNPVKLTVKAFDLNYNPVNVDATQIAWTIDGGAGTVKDMNFIPSKAGEIKVTATYKGKTKSIVITAVDTLIDLTVTPKTISYEDGTQSFKVVGTDAQGYKSVIDNSLLKWIIDQPIGTIVNGKFVPANGAKSARVDLSYKDIKEVAYILSGTSTKSLFDFNAMTVVSTVYPEIVVGKAQLKISEDSKGISLLYNFVPSEVAQAIYAQLTSVVIPESVDQLELSVDNYPADVFIKGLLTDSKNEEHTLTFVKNSKGVIYATLPDTVAYPVIVSRLYVVSLATTSAKNGEILIKDLIQVKKVTADSLSKVIEIPPVDSLYNTLPTKGYTLSIFGATSGRNRLLDEILMNKVYETTNKSDYTVFAGSSSVNTKKITNQNYVYANKYVVKDLIKARIITLAMSTGSMVKTDATQWAKLSTSLSTSVQDTIIVIGTEKLRNNSDKTFTNEGQVIHEMLRDFVKKSGKKVFYVNASDYSYGLELYEGIRYIDLNGIWYNVKDSNTVNLYDDFKVLNFNFESNKVTYRVDDLFPKTTVAN